MKAVVANYGLADCHISHRTLYIRRVPTEIAGELAQRLAEIASAHRDCCSFAEQLTLEGKRAPLVGWVDRYGHDRCPWSCV